MQSLSRVVKIDNGSFVEKMTIFVNFFEKNVKFLAIFWQSNGNFPEGQLNTMVKIKMCFSVMWVKLLNFGQVITSFLLSAYNIPHMKL